MIKNLANLTKAHYTPQALPEYSGNPFIEALPPIWSPKEVIGLLAHDPQWHEGEREMDESYRFHCVWRLFRFFQPIDTHIDIEQRVSRAIRQGYLDKNPTSPAYAKQLGQGFRLIQDDSEDFGKYYSGSSSACGFTIIGVSGVGKTTATNRILSLYPQAIQHTNYRGSPLCLTQITWLKIDCPFDGFLKGLCLNFFQEVDRVLGTEYFKKFTRGTHPINALMGRMAQIATLHGLGLLVIDEIQHLSMAKSGGSEKMLNFFVTLVNTIGVPIILIGTTKALPVLQGDFRQARRGSGQGDLLWERMENSQFWDVLIESMWKNQWTKKQVRLTDELRDVIYDESQGIIDIAIKLYAMVQIKAIATGSETFNADDFQEVAAKKLRLVKPMLDALRSGDAKKLAQYEDIRSISIDDYAAAYQARLPSDFVSDFRTKKPELEEQAILKLLEMGIPTTIAKKAVKKELQNAQSGQPLSELLQKSFKIAINIQEKPTKSKPEPTPDNKPTTKSDMRETLEDSGNLGDAKDAYIRLKNTQIIAEGDEF